MHGLGLRIKKEVVYQFIINIFLCLIFSICVEDSEECALIAILSTVQIIINSFFLAKVGVKSFSFSMLFVWLTYVFHFGNVLLIALNQEKYCAWDIIGLSYSIGDFNNSCLFSMLCSGMVSTGIMFAYGRNKIISENQVDKIEHKKQIRIIFTFGVILFAVTVIPTFLLQWNRIQVVLNGGLYSQTRSADSELGIAYYLTRFFPFTLIMIMIGLQDKPQRARIVYFCSCAYELVCMISGNRSLQLIAIVIYTFTYINIVSHNKIKISYKVFLLVSAYIGSALINVLMRVRNFGITNYDFASLMTEALDNNPILSVLGEFGITQVTVSLAISNYPRYVPFKCGLTYLVSLMAWCIPITGTEFFRNSTVFLYEMQFGSQLTLGGSYIGELFANFGWYGFLGAFFVGLFVGITCTHIFFYIKQENWYRLIPLLVLFYFNLFWVRNFFYGFVFTYFGIKIFLAIGKAIVVRKT